MKLLSWDGEREGPGLQARVRGSLGLTDTGCVTIGDLVVIAPPGSRVDGDTVHLDGLGDFSLGDWVDTQGGHFELSEEPAVTTPRGLAACAVDGWVVIG